MDLSKNGIGIISTCFLRIFVGYSILQQRNFFNYENFLEKEVKIMTIKLEPRDVARLSTLGNNKCRKCNLEFMEGNTVIRVGARPTKYFHLECFKAY